MKHAREDYNVIQDTTAARKLADLVLSMDMVTDKGLVARRLAREVLGITDAGRAPAMNPITTNGTTRLIPDDEPVAWQISYPNGDCIFTKDINIAEIHRAAGRHVAPLYLHAPAEQDKEAGK